MGYTGQKKRDYDLEWRNKRRLAWIEENGPCVKCGSLDRLEVDHIDPSEKSFHPREVWSRTLATREAELSKCQVLCYTCHKAKTREQKTIIAPHGTYERYSRKDEYKCRCTPCRATNAEYARERRALVNA